MNKPFDAATKQLIQAYPADWLALAGFPVDGEISIVDADLAAIHLSADKLIRVAGPKPYISHVEFQSGPETDLDERILGYNIPIRHRHRLRVRSVAFILRPQALSPANTGRVLDIDEDGNGLDFRYRLVKVWEQPVEAILAGGLGTLPLAPISNVPQEGLAETVRRMEERINAQEPAIARELELAAYVLMGLRYSREMTSQLLRGVRQMKESVTYQAIYEDGKEDGVVIGEARGEARGERKALILVGTKKFGPPDATTLQSLSQIDNLQRFERMIEKLDFVHTWAELLES